MSQERTTHPAEKEKEETPVVPKVVEKSAEVDASSSETVEKIDETLKDSKTKEEKEADIDDLVEAIDEVLQTDAEEFVKNFVQRGGQ